MDHEKLIDKYDKVTVKNAILFACDGAWFIDVTYVCEDNNGVYEYRIPKVRVPLEQALLQRDFTMYIEARYLLCLPYSDLPVHIVNNVAFQKKILREKPREMTIADIENVLGYKVKIVSAKKESIND